MINIQYFATAQDIIDAYGSNIPSNVVCIAGNNDSILINSGNNNPHTNKEEQDKTTIVDKIKNQNITVDPTEETIILRHDDKYTGLGTVTITGIQASRLMKYITENGEYHYTPEKGHYYTGIDIQINVQPELQDKEIKPSREEQVIGCDEGKYGLRSVTVRAVTAEIDPDIKAENIRKGVEILGIYGTFTPKVDNITINPTTARQSFVTPEGVDGYDKVFVEAVTSSIDGNIQPENIKQGVSILGVEGTLREGSGGESNVFVVPDWVRFGFARFEEIPSNLDFSNMSTMSWMFSGCNNITTVQSLGNLNATDMSSMFRDCIALTTIQSLDTSSATDISWMFAGCNNLTSVPQLITNNVTNMHYLFQYCSNLTTIPSLNTSSVIDASGMFDSCSNLTTIPLFDFSNVTNASYMFNSCSNLTTIPSLNTSSVIDASSMFAYCSNLTTIPSLNTSNMTNALNMFENCNNLTTVEGIDFSGLTTELNNLFAWTSNMPKLTRFIVNGKINVSISDDFSIKALTNIDYDSVKSILAAADRTDNTNEKTLAFNRTMTDQNGELAALVTSCTSKGWIITGLTIV